MTTYVFSRGDGHELDGLPRGVVRGQMFFELWRTRQQPFADLRSGDTMLLFDTRSRRLIWEFRATAITRAGYESMPDALDLLRDSYGLLPGDLNGYIWNRPAQGWLFAWAAEVVRPLDVEMPAGFRMTDFGGRNGYVAWASVPSDLRPDLPPPSEEAPLPASAAHVGGSHAVFEGSRYIPVSVRRTVWARDEGRCVECGRHADDVEIHLDHRYPHSRGGSNDPDNLQLLCRDHNLRKAARVVDGVIVPTGLRLRHAVADRLRLPRTAALEAIVAALGDDHDGIVDLLLDEAGNGNHPEVESLLQHGIAHSDLVTAAVALQLDADDGNGAIRAREYAEQLWAASTDNHARAAAALVLAGHRDGKERAALLAAATDSPDYDIEPEAQLLVAADRLGSGDHQGAEEALVAAYARGPRDIRAEAAVCLYELRADGVDLERLHMDQVSELEELLRVALGGHDGARATAALYLAGLLDRRVDPDVIESLLDLAEREADNAEIRAAARQAKASVSR